MAAVPLLIRTVWSRRLYVVPASPAAKRDGSYHSLPTQEEYRTAPGISLDEEGCTMADQMIEIIEYDPVWVERFVEQRVRLDMVLAPWLAGTVEHIGSTSVPGLRAKPIIDILAPV